MNKMRRIERQMNAEEVKELLNRGEYGILSTVDSDNQPYGTPLSYVMMNNNIYFHCAVEGTKLNNIQSSNKVCFTVVGKTNVLPDKFSTEYESIMAFGRAIFAEGEEKIGALREIVRKYSPEFMNEGEEYIQRAKDKTKIVRIEIETVTGKHRI